MKSIPTKLVVLGAAATLALSACSSDSDSSDSDSSASGSGAVTAENSLSGIPVTVGSKDFDEQLLLGEILVQAFEAAGAERNSISKRTTLFGSVVPRSTIPTVSFPAQRLLRLMVARLRRSPSWSTSGITQTRQFAWRASTRTVPTG